MSKAMLKLAPKTVLARTAKLIEKIEAIRSEITALKNRCAHDWEYEGDPSGNNDTGYYCSACNAWRKNLP